MNPRPNAPILIPVNEIALVRGLDATARYP